VSEPLHVRLGGYSPEGSTHSRGLDRISSSLRAELGADVEVEIDYNCLDSGRQVHELLDDVESGALTACYFSTSYLADRVPELGIVDLPFVFGSLQHAHRCLDGELGSLLSERTSARTGLVPFGYWDNGMRHLSNRLRPVRLPDDCRGLRIRLQPNWAHERFFADLGALPVLTDLRDGIAMIERGEVDAQENPLANFVSYGIERVHPHLTLSGHAYGARGVYASAAQLRAWPVAATEALRKAVATAVVEQRADAEAKEVELRSTLEQSGTKIVELEPQEQQAFVTAAAPVLARARELLGESLFALLDG
jgi:TRAP-type C4-dicarboxylate transport system substrate-binding protein